MPNYCSNDLIITAKTKKGFLDLKTFKDLAFTKNFYSKEEKEEDRHLYLDFEKFVPYPKVAKEQEESRRNIEAMKEKGENTNKQEILHKLTYGNMEFGWNDWRCMNWGTKWNAKWTKSPEEKQNRLVYVFDTAWSPPIPIVIAMSEMFPNLNFKLKYYEQGMCFQGTFECKDGKVKQAIHKDNYRGGRGG